MSIECNTPEHDEVMCLAWVAIAIYPVGLLVAFGLLLFKARKAILSNRPTRLSRAIAFLHREYETHMMWYARLIPQYMISTYVV